MILERFPKRFLLLSILVGAHQVERDHVVGMTPRRSYCAALRRLQRHYPAALVIVVGAGGQPVTHLTMRQRKRVQHAPPCSRAGLETVAEFG
jgi:hypothetical protein